jgi:hypothetical protein
MTKLNITFNQYESERLYPIGFEFTLKRGKADPKQCKIVNYAITYNLNGNVTQFRYLVQYDFCGQNMVEDMVQTTIDIATNNGWKNLTEQAV